MILTSLRDQLEFYLPRLRALSGTNAGSASKDSTSGTVDVTEALASSTSEIAAAGEGAVEVVADHAARTKKRGFIKSGNERSAKIRDSAWIHDRSSLRRAVSQVSPLWLVTWQGH